MQRTNDEHGLIKQMSDVTKILSYTGGDALNMGWTSVGLWRISLTFVGLFVILFTLVLLLSFDNYRDNTDDKTVPLVIASVGFFLFILGVFLTDRRFSAITTNMKKNPLFFSGEGFAPSVESLKKNIEALNELKDELLIVEAITKGEEKSAISNIAKLFEG